MVVVGIADTAVTVELNFVDTIVDSELVAEAAMFAALEVAMEFEMVAAMAVVVGEERHIEHCLMLSFGNLLAPEEEGHVMVDPESVTSSAPDFEGREPIGCAGCRRGWNSEVVERHSPYRLA